MQGDCLTVDAEGPCSGWIFQQLLLRWHISILAELCVSPCFVLLQVGKVFKIDNIVEAHRCMEENRGGGKIVVLT